MAVNKRAVTFEVFIVRLCNLCHSTCDVTHSTCEVTRIKMMPRGLPYD